MNRDQAREVYKEIKMLFEYFNFNNDEKTTKVWVDRLEHGDYQKTKQKLFDYSMTTNRIPTLADIIVPIHKPINTELTDIQAAEEAVRREKADPELNAKREAAIKRMGEKLEELKRSGK